MPYSAWATQLTNIFSNPNFRLDTGVPQEVRRNSYLRSRMDSTTGCTNPNGSTIVAVAGGGIRVTCVAGGTQQSGLGVGGNTTAVANGDVVTYAFDVTGVVADSWYVSAQGTTSGTINGTQVAVGVGETKRISVTVTHIAAGTPTIYILRANPAVASQAIVTAPMQDFWPSVRPFFNGDSLNTDGWVRGWVGTANLSVSLEKAPVIAETNISSCLAYKLPSGALRFQRSVINAARMGLVVPPIAASTAYTLLVRFTISYTPTALTLVVRPNIAAATSQITLPLPETPVPGQTYEWTIPFTTSGVTWSATSGVAFVDGAITTALMPERNIDIQYFGVVVGTYSGPFFDGSTPDPVPNLQEYTWTGTPDASTSIFRTRTYTPPAPVTPVKNLTTEDVLYGDRITTYRWEVLEHSNGVDQLVGILDGVSDGQLSWTQNVAVKGGGKAKVVDLDVAAAGMWRVGDLSLESVRLRPVCVIQGLPENPLGVFLVSAAAEDWDDTGRVWNLELLDKCTVPSQDSVDESYAVAQGTLILQQVRTILGTSNEYIAINEASTLATSSGMVWEAGTSKLKIINDLLDVAGYNALWMDGYGNFQVTPRVLPADRSINYEVLGIPRELRDGEQAIYRPSWSRDRDSFEVPNKVIAVEAAGGDDSAALIGTWTNEDPTSSYSYVARGRWIPHVLDSVEVPEGTNAEKIAFLQARARTTLVQMSAVQATVKIEHLPIPVRVSDVVRFSHTDAGIDARHVITKLDLDVSSTGLMKSTLQEVISL